MTMNLPDWFPDKWTDEVKIRAQQTKTALADYVDNFGTFQGDHVYFPRIGQVDAVEGQRLQTLLTTAPPMDWISVLAKPRFLPIPIWDPDKNKLTIPVVQKFAQVVVNGMARARDRMTRDAINTAVVAGVTGVRGPSADATAAPATENITTLGDYNTVVDLDALAQAYSTLGSNFSVEGEDIVFVSPFKVSVNMSLDPYMAKSDTNIDWVSKIKFTTYEYLYDNAGVEFNAASTGADCYMFARSAVNAAYNDEMKEINERMGANLADLIGQWFQGGASVVEPKGLVRLKTKTNFTIARKPIPILNFP